MSEPWAAPALGIPAFQNHNRIRIRLRQTTLYSHDPNAFLLPSPARQRVWNQDEMPHEPASCEVLGPVEAQIRLGEKEAGRFSKECFPTLAKHHRSLLKETCL